MGWGCSHPIFHPDPRRTPHGNERSSSGEETPCSKALGLVCPHFCVKPGTVALSAAPHIVSPGVLGACLCGGSVDSLKVCVSPNPLAEARTPSVPDGVCRWGLWGVMGFR